MNNPRQLIPLFFTLGAMLAGFLSMLMSAAGLYVQAAQMIMLSMILDGLDGTIARRLKATSDFGAELDTFVDFSSFGIAPAMLAYQAYLKDFGLWGFLIASAVIISGASRLARFRIIDPYRGQKGYLGMPITVNAGWIALFIYLGTSGILDEDMFSLSAGLLAAFVWGIVVIQCALEISHIRYDKPTKDPLVQASCVLLVVMMFLDLRLGAIGAITMLGYGFMYAFVSPFFFRRRLILAARDEEEAPVSVRH